MNTNTQANTPTTPAAPTLYERLGSTSGIRALVDDILQAHMENDVIKARFLPYADQPERLAELKGLLAKFLEAGSGGPAEYTGRSMVEAHRGLNIGAAEYMAAIDDIMAVLAKHEVDETARKDVLFISYSLMREIVLL
jgi:hemoglobin